MGVLSGPTEEQAMRRADWRGGDTEGTLAERRTGRGVPRVSRGGLALALSAAAVSGLSVFLNTYAVHHVRSATAFTTAKNLVAAFVLLTLAAALPLARARSARLGALAMPRRPSQWGLLALIAVTGGSVPFVLFFEGAAMTSATDAALIQKTLVIWVALLALPMLGERLSRWHVLAIVMLLAGQFLLLTPSAGDHANTGNLMVLAATLLWSAETVALKVALRSMAPLTVGMARLGLGVLLILGYLAVRGQLGTLAGLGIAGWEWALLMGVVLAVYVGLWLGALARAPATDVTAVLVGGAFVTAALDAAFQGDALTSHLPSLALIAAAVTLLALLSRRRAPSPAP
jgi:drug/metabolite transporter (DMT)-like permease